MVTDITHRHALITGASHRLGRAMAEHLAQAGWDITVHYNTSADAAQDLVTHLETFGGRAQGLQADLSNPEAARVLMADATKGLGPVGLLVNNASVFEDDCVLDFTDEDWAKHMAPNFQAPVTLAQAFAAHLPNKERGLVINITDQRVWRTTPRYFTYTLSKCALWAATPVMAQALAPRVRVNAIGPGPVLRNPRMSEEDFQAQGQKVPLQQVARVDEILGALDYFITASSVTGQMIAVDSGQHLSWQTPDVVDVTE